MVSALDILAAYSRITNGRTTEKRQNAESFNRQNTTCLCETDRRYVSLEQLCTRRKVEVLIHTRLKESIGKKLLRVLRASVVHFFLAISTRRHGDHGDYTERFDFSDRFLKPGVNETGLSPKEFDSLWYRNRLFVQGPLEICHVCVRRVLQS